MFCRYGYCILSLSIEQTNKRCRCVMPTRQQLAVVQSASQGSYTGAMVGYMPLLQCIRDLTVGLDPAQTENARYEHAHCIIY